MRLSIFALLPLLLGACGGSEWGTELSQQTPQCLATIYHSEAVDPALAQQVFQAMIDGQYNFASGLPEQIDRVDGRLTLRLGNDNEESMASVLANGEDDGVVSYMRGLASHVSQAVGGEPVDIVLCRKVLSEPYYTVVWKML